MAITEDDLEAPIEGFGDRIAERAEAYATLITTVAEIGDPELRAEGMRMLAVVRESIKTPPRGQLAKVK